MIRLGFELKHSETLKASKLPKKKRFKNSKNIEKKSRNEINHLKQSGILRFITLDM